MSKKVEVELELDLDVTDKLEEIAKLADVTVEQAINVILTLEMLKHKENTDENET